MAAFERKIRVGRNIISSAIRRKSSISHEVLYKICFHYPQYTSDWIIYGKESPHMRAVMTMFKVKKLLRAWKISETKDL